MPKLIAWIVGLSVFIGWIMLVGNPHVVETVIGLALGLASGFWTYFKLRKFAGNRQNGA